MLKSVKVVAILCASPALSSIVAGVLAARPGLRVRRFESMAELLAYLRIAPVDLLICDEDPGILDAAALARTIRVDRNLARREMKIIALARAIDGTFRREAIAAGIDEVIAKPMSPGYLRERVLARLGTPVTFLSAPSGYFGPDRRDRAGQASLPVEVERRGSNVIELFGRGRPAPVRTLPPQA
ncbi:MAG TPA: response regulator [Devosiaceae bacterium]